MLSPREKEGLTEILERLDNHALISLAGTVTKNMVKPETRKEAVSIILMYSENAFSLLNRRKIKKEILFHYLKDNGITSPVSEKVKLVIECLKLWESDIDYENLCEMEDVEESEETNSVSPETPSYNGNFLVTPVAVCQTTTHITFQQQVPPMISDIERMGQEFVTWFYGLLNNINVEIENFHPNHFWPDCIMHLQISATDVQLQSLGIENSGLNSIHNEQILGAQNVTDTLVKIVAMGKLLFHPNSTHYGVTCSMERHGLVKVLASGVLHKDNLCIGLFDQSFGLVRSPNDENNWKIKYMELLLKVNTSYNFING